MMGSIFSARMLRRGIIALTLGWVHPVHAGNVADAGFLAELDHIGQNERDTGAWIVLLGVIADRCPVKIDGNAFADLYAGQHLNRMIVSADVRYFRKAVSPMAKAWTALADASQDHACRLALDLWGQQGRQFRGILVADGGIVRPD